MLDTPQQSLHGRLPGSLPTDLIVGAGKTGASFLRYLNSKKRNARVYDDRLTDEKCVELKSISAKVEFCDNQTSQDQVLQGIKRVLLSPGIDLQHPLVKKAQEKRLELVGDIELFVSEDFRPIIAVTGSNAKSTVVTLLGLMAEAEGIKASVAGNIGNPVLDFLKQDNYQLFVFELSSFQLDITRSLRAKVACILNVTPDHLDRYKSFQDYALSKQAIYKNCEFVVFNRKDDLTYPIEAVNKKIFSFGLDEPQENQFGIKAFSDIEYLCFGCQKIMPVQDLPSQAKHNLENVLAALAIGYCAGIRFSSMSSVLKTFKGLPHRCELVLAAKEVIWINDSKGTNVGACEAAIRSFSQGAKKKNIILLAGGDSKGADLGILRDVFKTELKSLLLIGKDAPLFIKASGTEVDSRIFENLEQAVQEAGKIAEPGDIVLLSPACSSLDMYKNYMERGDHFRNLVNKYFGAAI